MKLKNFFVAFSLIALGIVFGIVLVSSFGNVKLTSAETIVGTPNPPLISSKSDDFSSPFIEVAEKVTPSIVQITVVSERKISPQEDFWFFPFREFDRRQRGSGSGVIISEDGYILTNNHVVENATKLQVQMHDKRIFEASIVGTDPTTDLAVIKVDAKNLPAAYLGDSDEIKVGQWVMAIGNPLSLNSTVTAGIISAKGRSIGIIGRNTENRSYAIENFIQTDAAINPGNSGGALVDLKGAVIGINTAIATGGTGNFIGYGFAIPINLAKTVAKEIIEKGKVERGFIGVQISEVNAATAKAVGLDKPKGVIVQSVVSDGAAAEAGIQEGDIILSIDGREVNQPNQLQSYIATKTAGTTVNLSIYRDRKIIEKKVKLKPRTVSETSSRASKKEEKSNTKKISTYTFENLGLTVKDMTSEEKEAYGIKKGILITNVKSFSPAEDQGLFSGLAIEEVDRNQIDSTDEFKKIIEDKTGSAVLLKVVDKQKNSRYLGLEIPKK
jgi:serine protease Do